MNKRKHASMYARHVVAVLAPHFTDLQQEATAMVVTAAIERHLADPDPAWEVILDSGYTANWRLRPAVAPGQVHVACYRQPYTSTDREREAQLTALLHLKTS
ncbi:hypothetical protein [Planomonospora sp. ID82291]|uniref:hypothetical protein n=1 Tax=Planomonospora sp. ID82291 TaxID=2738136 RepID=UPI0018C3D3CF|nr:hypothetical protein [Planomonospora sp. ID82291]MBG0818333.1 hypothetical protein [Planomonospora sp. ID82291]